MCLPITKIGSAVLRKKCSKLSPAALNHPRLGRFLSAMVATMRKARGVGLSANQAGRGIKAIVLECRSNKRYPARPDFPLQIYLNPSIVKYSGAKSLEWEGCLSIPGYRGLVPRARQITLRALSANGTPVLKKFSGFEARVVQHEVDHLNGLFYTDRMKDFYSWMHLDEFNSRFHSRIQLPVGHAVRTTVLSCQYRLKTQHRHALTVLQG